MKIIGVELRLQHNGRYGNQQHEIAIIPCDIEVELDNEEHYQQCYMNGTIHTSQGDVNIPMFSFPFPAKVLGIKFKQTR